MMIMLDSHKKKISGFINVLCTRVLWQCNTENSWFQLNFIFLFTDSSDYYQNCIFYFIFVYLFLIFSKSLGGMQSVVMSMSVCLSVCSRNSKTARSNFTKFFVHVACGHGLVLLWQQWNMLCISSEFVDDIIFSYHGAKRPESSTVLCLKEVRRWWYQLPVSVA